MIRFSVVIPLYNKKDYIFKCLESVFKQEYYADEIIVINDGSTDGGAELIRESFGGRVNLISQVNSGVSCARNVGLEHATNEYVCLLDADDCWEPGFLMEIRFLILRHPECIKYGTAFWYADTRFGVSVSRTKLPSDFFGPLNFLPAYAAASGIICSSSVCIRKSVFRSGLHFPEGKVRGEDIHLWLRLGMLGDFGFSGKRLVSVYRDEVSPSYLVRADIVSCYLEWIIEVLPSVEDCQKKSALRRILWKHTLINGMVALTQKRRLLLTDLYSLVWRRHGFLGSAVLGLHMMPPCMIILIRRVVSWRNRRS